MRAARSGIITALIFGVALVTASSAAADEVNYYRGPHAVPSAYGGFCQITVRHFHTYKPDDMKVFRFEDQTYNFIGDPTAHGYTGPRIPYYGHHPIPSFWGGGWCFISGPHYHFYRPVGTVPYRFHAGIYYYSGPYTDPWYIRNRAIYEPIFSHYYVSRPGYIRPLIYGAPPSFYAGPRVVVPFAPWRGPVVRVGGPSININIGGPRVGVGVRPGVVGGPGIGVRPGVVGGGVGVHPGVVGGGVGVRPGTVGGPGVHPGTVGGPGVHPGTVGGPGVHPGAAGGAGVHPGAAGGPGLRPGTTLHPGAAGGAAGSPGLRPGTTVHPGGAAATPPIHPGAGARPGPAAGTKVGTVPRPGPMHPGPAGGPKAGPVPRPGPMHPGPAAGPGRTAPAPRTPVAPTKTMPTRSQPPATKVPVKPNPGGPIGRKR